MFNKILVVCVGNICRSPTAERLLRSHLPQMTVESAGLGALVGPSQVGARVIGYSADTSFDPTLVAWLAASEVFFHETNFGVHTPLASLLALPEAQRRHMRLIHYPDQLEPAQVAIACAREGEWLRL